MRKKLICLCLCVFMFAGILFTGCGKEDGYDSDRYDGVELPIATIKIEGYGNIVVELYPEIAPETVSSFITLANDGFYDGLIFHRVIPEFMIQGGDPKGDGTGGPGYCIKGEFSNNGVENDIKHEAGVISMGRQGSQYNDNLYYNTAGSQFFICVEDCDWLDGKYAAFGKVISGLHYAIDISEVSTNANDKPVEKDVVITSIRVETKGVDYSKFTKLPEK